MVNRANRFNIYLVVATLLAAVGGCQNPAKPVKPKKPPEPYSTVRIHLEVRPDGTDHSQVVPIYREHPVNIVVNKVPFLTEADVAKATTVDELGGFALRLEFTRQGSHLLEQYSASNTGRRFAIFTQFVNPTNAAMTESRWLGAPRIPRRITDGVLTFTPDASLDEAKQIVRGLNHVARKRDDTWP